MQSIMDFSASNHIIGTTYLFTSYDTKRLTTQKVYISDGKQLSIVGYGDVKIPNSTLEDSFHVQDMPINLLSIYSSCKKTL